MVELTDVDNDNLVDLNSDKMNASGDVLTFVRDIVVVVVDNDDYYCNKWSSVDRLKVGNSKHSFRETIDRWNYVEKQRIILNIVFVVDRTCSSPNREKQVTNSLNI